LTTAFFTAFLTAAFAAFFLATSQTSEKRT
jgi:hypothetical protein